MRKPRSAGLMVAALVMATVIVSPVHGVAPVPAAAPQVTGATGPVVTLVTGDEVRLGGPHGAVTRPAPGREHITFRTWTDQRQHVHVVPADAAAGITAGRLDPALFDVTGLVTARYHDAARADLPLIVDYPDNAPRAASGARVTRELPSAGAAAVLADRTPEAWAGLLNAEHVWLDAPVRAALDRSVPRIRAPEAWAAGHTGGGAVVAVLDTGIDATHPDLADAVAGAQDFTGGETGVDDYAGHGTHVASIITGAGAKYRGVAPDARLLNGKVLNDFGSGMTSWIIAGMEWAAAGGADVINLSLGGGNDADGTDPLSQAVNRISEETGVLVVVAAGNDGKRATWTVGSPAAAEEALTVGAVDSDDVPADFSTPGPRSGDAGIKPDITAPGVGIVAAKAAHGQLGDPVDDGHVAMSGTSMAAPHVAGAAAILAAQHPDWTARQLKAALMNTADPAADTSVFKQGAGRVDVAAAVAAEVTASPGSVSLGRAVWPHTDDQPLSGTVTYTNNSAVPVTLDLTTEVPGAPDGMFGVSPATLTVPAGGQASATVTADTRVEAPDRQYPGLLVATGTHGTLRTPVSVDREVESYDLTLNLVDADGKPTGEYFMLLIDTNGPWGRNSWDPSGTIRYRLPKGEYFLAGDIDGAGGARFHEPAIALTKDTTLTIDARKRKALSFTLDKPDAALGVTTVSYTRQTSDGPRRGSIHSMRGARILVVPSQTSSPEFEFGVEAQLARPDGDGVTPDFTGSPYLYCLHWSQRGQVPADLHRTVRDGDLARVEGSYARTAPGTVGVRDEMVAQQLPFTLTEFYTPDVPVYPRFYEERARYDYVTFNDAVVPQVYRLGHTARARYNTAVFGPGFPYHEDYPNFMLSAREEDRLGFNLPLLSDQDPTRVSMTPPGDATGSMRLLHDGKVVGDWPYPTGGGWEVGPEEATYTVQSDATFPTNSLSTKISGEWTFRSAHVPGPRPEPLPLLAVRFAPSLDLHNTAPAGNRFRFPVYVQRGGSNPPVALTAPPSVDVSYDDGVTWRGVRLSRDGDRWLADVDHPAGAKFVSLRTSVTDQEGNGVKYSIIRAYGLR